MSLTIEDKLQNVKEDLDAEAYLYEHGFNCNHKELHSIFQDKRSFFRIEFLVNQYTIENLFAQESKAFEDFQLVKFPKDWKSKT